MATKKTTPAPAKALIELGGSGLKRWGGFIHEEFLTELTGTRGMKKYREMRDNSAIIGACMGAIELLIRQVPWHVESFSEAAEDKRRADFLDECRADMSTSWPETVVEQLSMLTYGFAACEIVYKRREGDTNDPQTRSRFSDSLIGWRKLPLRAQDTITEWDFDANGGVRGFWQTAPPELTRTYIPTEKALYFKPRTEKANPEGRSVLRNAYFEWYKAKKVWEIEGIALARELTGIPVGRVPAAEMPSEDKPNGTVAFQRMRDIVTGIEVDEQHGLVLPSNVYPQTQVPQYDIGLISSPGKRTYDTTAVQQYLDRKIAMTMLFDVLLMGEPNTIQYKGKGLPNLFGTALAGWLDGMAEVYNSHAIPRLMRLNGWPADRAPRLAHGPVEVQDLGVLGDFLSKAVDAGMPWGRDRNIDRHLRRVANLPAEDPAAQRPEPTAPALAREEGEGPPG
jgi:hypothetical protein